MKIGPRTLGSIVFLLFIVFSILAVSTLHHYDAAARANLASGALHSQMTTPTQIADDASEIGSTDGIVLMGVIIILIIVVPILIQRKNWQSN